MKCLNCSAELVNDVCLNCGKVKDGIKVGDTITFGRYEQNKVEYLKQPIIWRVLNIDNENNKALLLSDKIIEYKSFDNTGYRVSWFNSSLARHLNYELLDEMFTKEEIEQLLVISDYKKLCLLWDKQVKEFLPEKEMRVTTPTEFARSFGADKSWWLADRGYYEEIDYHDYYDVTDENAEFIHEDGVIDEDGISRGCKKGIRPVICVKLNRDGKINETDEKPLSVGELVAFGKYPQTGEYEEQEPDDIEWLVVDENEDAFLLVSKLILDNINYTNREDRLADPWADCFARKWLNDDFVSNAFTGQEKDCIINTKLDNGGFGEDTIDKVFLLSPSEIEKVMPDKVDRKSTPTPRLEQLRKNGIELWLRSTSTDGKIYYINYYNQGVTSGTYYSGNTLGVRPAIWLKK